MGLRILINIFGPVMSEKQSRTCFQNQSPSKRKHTVRCERESTAPETLLSYRSRLISCNVSSTIHSYCS
ncbi:hypothetical protein L2E82_27022 [Cichorium intybus]|uniref:Uncharacterized protein n=1 Tax=Cichorium intybus TaxID=13427 RepID=A0ACB9CS77_CICIN|nr:hypothetical protein L2E82_27022 [Cichorium intybus]